MSNSYVFRGFPQEGLQFLEKLATRNNREWFEAHQAIYRNALLEPAIAFVTELGERLQTISGAIHYDSRTNGSGTLMRIHRDTRFSKDKTPYKTHISGLFWEGAGKKTESPAFGFRLQAGGMGLMAGIFAFPKPMLAQYRAAILHEQLGSELERCLKVVKNSGNYALEGKHYKQVPRGFDATHPRAAFLCYNGLYVTTPEISPEDVTKPKLVDQCFQHFQNMTPVQQWLVRLYEKR